MSCWIVRSVFLYNLPFNRTQERSQQALDRLPLVSNFLTNFWMQHVDGARLSQNSVRNSVWHALNEYVCQYLRKRNPRCSSVYIDNNLGSLARDSPCIYKCCKSFIPKSDLSEHKCGKSRRVNCTLAQALSICTGRTANKENRGIDLLFLDHGTRRG